MSPQSESVERNAEVPRQSQSASLSPSELEQFHMHGQDIAWLLADRATKRGDHPALIWAPRDGDGRQWTYTELDHDVRRVAAGLAGRGVRIGDHVLIHAENCPEMVLAWLACAVVGAVAVTTNTKSVPHEIASFIARTDCVGAITQPRYAAAVSGASDSLQWVVVTEDNSGEAPARRRGRPRARGLRVALRRRRQLDRTPGGPDAPLLHHVHLGHHEQSQGRGAHPCQCDLGQPHRPAQHRPDG